MILCWNLHIVVFFFNCIVWLYTLAVSSRENLVGLTSPGPTATDFFFLFLGAVLLGFLIESRTQTVHLRLVTSGFNTFFFFQFCKVTDFHMLIKRTSLTV